MSQYSADEISAALDRIEDAKRQYDRVRNTYDYVRFDASEELQAAFKAFAEMVRSAT